MNHLIAIGHIGIKRCYLNITLEEAKERYQVSEEVEDPPADELIQEFDFENEFCAYDCYSA